jgi:hypothetical protein
MIGTRYNIYDQSAIEEISQVEETDDSPVVLSAFASAKGTEDWFDLKAKLSITCLVRQALKHMAK